MLSPRMAPRGLYARRPGDQEPDRRDGRRFRGKGGADRGSATAEQRGQRRGKGHRRQTLEDRPLCPLTACKRRAFLARADVRPQSTLFRSRQSSIQLFRECELRLVARQRSIELLAQRTPRTEDQRLDGADGDPDDLRDLGIRASFELTHDERGTLIERELAECAPDVGGARSLLLGNERTDAVVELNFVRPAGG